ncbi:MAG: hypothetical protein IJW99_11415 [Clostridia bacterium]|nr:hypothetical protein [Clostridia bacterium]
MKRVLSVFLLLALCLALASCGDGNETATQATTRTTTHATTSSRPANYPTIESVVEGIKYEFKDPDSVQLTDASIAVVKSTTSEPYKYENNTEYYIIGTVRAKNSFGGYGEPQAYIIHCKNGRYTIVGEYNDYSWAMQGAFNELGCGPSSALH